MLTLFQQLTTITLLVPQQMPADASPPSSASYDTIIVRTVPGEQESDNQDSINTHHHLHDSPPEAHSDHSGHQIHIMPMVSIGAPGEVPDFFTVGMMAEYQLSVFDHRMGVGLMGMLMSFNGRTHLMLLATGSIYFDKHWSLLLELGSTHGPNEKGTKHEMSPMIGIGAGRHFSLGAISIVPMFTGEYSRLQKPTYSFSVGFVLF